MKQVIQNVRNGDLKVQEIPAPAVAPQADLIANPINEALMTGLYVITTKQGFLADIITDERGSSLDSVEASEVAKELTWISQNKQEAINKASKGCLLYTSPSPRDRQKSRMPSSA